MVSGTERQAVRLRDRREGREHQESREKFPRHTQRDSERPERVERHRDSETGVGLRFKGPNSH